MIDFYFIRQLFRRGEKRGGGVEMEVDFLISIDEEKKEGGKGEGEEEEQNKKEFSDFRLKFRL